MLFSQSSQLRLRSDLKRLWEVVLHLAFGLILVGFALLTLSLPSSVKVLLSLLALINLMHVVYLGSVLYWGQRVLKAFVQSPPGSRPLVFSEILMIHKEAVSDFVHFGLNVLLGCGAAAYYFSNDLAVIGVLWIIFAIMGVHKILVAAADVQWARWSFSLLNKEIAKKNYDPVQKNDIKIVD